MIDRAGRTFALAAALALSSAYGAAAATRGGTLVFGRAIESQFLDPVHTSQNADIWLALNLYDTPAGAGRGRQGRRRARPGHRLQGLRRRQDRHAHPAPRPEIRRRLAARAERREMVARPRPHQGDRRRFRLPARVHRLHRNVQAPDQVILHMAHPDPVIIQALATFNAGIMPEKLLMAAPGADLAEKSKNFAEHPIGSGPFVLSSWKRNSEMVLDEEQVLLAQGAGRAAAALPGLPSSSRSSRTTRPASSSCAPASSISPNSCLTRGSPS